MSRVFTIAIVAFILLFGLAFHLRNGQYVTIDYYVDSIALPLSLWVFLWIVVGVCLGVLAMLPALLKARRDNRRSRREIRRLESEADRAGNVVAGNVS